MMEPSSCPVGESSSHNFCAVDLRMRLKQLDSCPTISARPIQWRRALTWNLAEHLDGAIKICRMRIYSGFDYISWHINLFFLVFLPLVARRQRWAKWNQFTLSHRWACRMILRLGVLVTHEQLGWEWVQTSHQHINIFASMKLFR